MTTTYSVTAPVPKKRARPFENLFSRQSLPLPAIIFMIVVTQIPLILTLRYSLERWNLLRPERRAFIWFNNYINILENRDFWTIILNTLVLTLSVVVLSLILGMLLALLLNREFPGRNIVRTMLITPFLIMPTVSAVLWKNVLFNPAFGLLAAIYAMLGLPRPDLLADAPMASVITVIVWQWTPFMMLILLAGLQSLDAEQMEASQIDGAGRVTQFRYIVLPHLQRYIEIAVLMETLFILSVFGEIFVTTTGGPGIQTTNLSFGIYQEAFQRWNIGEASAMGIYAIILANIVVLLFVRVLRRGRHEGVTA
ncbi:MAG: sugar ABC transporter permease [Anaerolineae bacterium]|nr:sugar ABC transporter permease [Anaerolineae bacterium]